MTQELGRIQRPAAGLTTSWEAEIGSIRVLFGQGRMQEAGEVVQALGCRRILLVSDPGVREAGHPEMLRGTLERAKAHVFIYDRVEENPTSEHVEEGAAFATPQNPDCVLALGGGSAMDCAKGINFLLTNGGRMADYWGFGRVSRPLLPAIGIPTTAGTGSEAQSFALISESGSHRKMACGDPSARFRAVILDPNLLSTAPTDVAAASGMDAVSHALESFVSTRRNPVSRMLARQSWQLLHRYLDESLREDATAELRGHVLLAAHFAGAAIEQSMLGAAHACANPLTAAFGINHGQAVVLMLPHVIRFNSQVAAEDYAELAADASLDTSKGRGEAIATRVEEIRNQAGLPERLRELAVTKAEIPALAAAAAQEWTARFNPRPVSQIELESLYALAY